MCRPIRSLAGLSPHHGSGGPLTDLVNLRSFTVDCYTEGCMDCWLCGEICTTQQTLLSHDSQTEVCCCSLG